MFALGFSLYCADYLMEEDLKSYRLAPIDKDDIIPPHMALVSTMARLSAAKVALSGSSVEAMLLLEVPSSSTFVPPRVPNEATTTYTMMAALWGASLRCKRSVVVRSHKAPHIEVVDAPGRVATGAVASSRLATSTVTHG